MSQSISLCIIVKNEEPNLGRCLASVKELVDEIIVVDTGSTDRSQQIALGFGAKVLEAEWCDNFSASRNVSISAATSDWILVLDADEALDDSDFSRIRQLIEVSNTCYQLIARNYCNDCGLAGFIPNQGAYPKWEQGLLGYVESRVVRLFPNETRIRYSNCMHELVEPSIRDLPEYRILDSKICFHHFGKLRSEERINWKKKLYSDLAAKKAVENPDHWKSHYELGWGYVCSNDFAAAVPPLLRAIELSPNQTDSWLILGHAYGELANYKDAAICFLKAIELDPRSVQAYGHLGVVYLRTDRHAAAVDAFLKSIELNPLEFNAYCNLGEALLNLQAFQKARLVFEKTLEMVPDNQRGLLGLGISCALLKDYPTAEAVLLKCKAMPGSREVAEHWLAKIPEMEGPAEPDRGRKARGL